jgi:DNA-binding response OmpR family regulator
MKNNNILLVDNSQSNLILLEWFLSEHGYHTVSATNVNDAIQQIEVNIPDLVILELKLPGISGFDFLKIIKFHGMEMNIPVLVLSSFDSQDSIKRALMLRADGFMSKPVILRNLCEKINSLLKTEVPVN